VNLTHPLTTVVNSCSTVASAKRCCDAVLKIGVSASTYIPIKIL
jgi:hypothetical protein